MPLPSAIAVQVHAGIAADRLLFEGTQHQHAQLDRLSEEELTQVLLAKVP